MRVSKNLTTQNKCFCIYVIMFTNDYYDGLKIGCKKAFLRVPHGEKFLQFNPIQIFLDYLLCDFIYLSKSNLIMLLGKFAHCKYIQLCLSVCILREVFEPNSREGSLLGTTVATTGLYQITSSA